MKGTESLTRTLPGYPTEPLTPKAVEMPFGAFQWLKFTTTAKKGKAE